MLPFAWWSLEDLPGAFGASERIFVLDRVVLRRVTTEVGEIVSILDRANLIKNTETVAIKKARELVALSEVVPLRKTFVVQETIAILDRAILEINSVVRVMTARELLELVETPSLQKDLVVNETILILDRVELTQELISKIKTARELIALSELTPLDRTLTEVIETISILSRVALVKESLEKLKVARELVALSEATGFFVLALIDSCSITVADEDPENNRARCRFNTGVSCESVRIEKQVNSGGWSFHQDMNTAPNSGPFLSNYYAGSFGDEVRFRIKPYPEDLQQGPEGPICTTNEVTLGEA